MHARIHQKSKLAREIGPRQALIKNLVDSIILYERITTTQAKAKTFAPYFVRLVTKAKKGTLADKRAIHAAVDSTVAAQKLITELVKAWDDRAGGYTRIVKVANRFGDNSPMAVVELVLPANFGKKPVAKDSASVKTAKTSTKLDQKQVKSDAKAKTKTTVKLAPAKTKKVGAR